MDRVMRILFVEDREDDVLLIERELKRGGYELESRRVDTADEMRAALAANEYDLIISDYSMPQFDAMRALDVLQQSGLDLPFLVLSGTISEEIAVDALKRGAHDFIPKGNLKRLVPAVGRELREAESRRERRRAERDLKTTSETLSAAFNASPVPMILLDRNGNVLRWNATAERTFGWSAEEAIGRPLPYILPAEQPLYQQRLQDLFRGERLTSVEVLRTRKDGTKARLLLSAAAVNDAAGNAFAIMVILVDVTEHRALEEQFRQVQKMEAVGRLAGGIAHDFNNVLTAIEGYTSLLIADMEPSDPRREDAQEILHAAERASAFTRRLLAFSRKQVTQPASVELNSLVGELQKLLGRLIGEHVNFEVNVSPDPQFVFADTGNIEQVVINLVVNARDAVEGRRDPRVQLRTYRTHVAEPQAGDYCVIEVKDNGTGIAPEHLDHIFEPFYTTKDVGKGTGLGLSTVYGIAQQNQGFVRVQSKVNVGTTFSVFLPFRVPLALVIESEKAAAVTSNTLGNVLVVEDESAIRQLVVRILDREGYQVIAAADPREALDLLAHHPEIDVVLTDVMLPHMSGRELLQEIRRRYPHMRIILMSGYVEEQVDIDVPYLEKPFTPKELIAKLKSMSPVQD
jgi:two-component system cell cycle sensor histidine kinase/response regulator CckA